MINKSQKVSSLENIYKNLESGMPENKSIKNYALPNARQWLGGRYVALWVLPIYLIKRKRILYRRYKKHFKNNSSQSNRQYPNSDKPMIKKS